MIQKHAVLILLASFTSLIGCSQSAKKHESADSKNYAVKKTDEEWKKQLSPISYNVLREKGTERAFSGIYWDNHKKGTYTCAGCQQALFSSETKFESGTGWPSFFKPITEETIAIIKDTSFGMVREEVVCGRCGGHLGHVFEDGPAPTGLRYCLNSAALNFLDKK
jgi:peptide-methionine (R)-S-oxide reductase